MLDPHCGGWFLGGLTAHFAWDLAIGGLLFLLGRRSARRCRHG